ncbi:MAG: hypothetical protein K2Q06_14065 [Parvularculaceae bacterium]|nr:hypothetical protein [Parvularculaceae bacterium]
MRRAAALAFVAAALFLSACGQKPAGSPRYLHDECRRVAVVDAEDGKEIVGVEDLRFDAERGRLILSAYDRRAAERAARKKAEATPEGGVYVVDYASIAGAKTLAATRLVARGALEGGLRPHGLDVDPATGRIVFINRGYFRQDGRWTMRPSVVLADSDGAVTDETPARCAANSVSFGRRIVTTFDHARCGWRALVEEMRGAAESGVADIAGAPLFKHATYANGIARLDHGRLALASTRDRAILVLSPEADGTYNSLARIPVPGGPDNLTIGDRGGIIAALHPNLFRLALQRRLGVGSAPSRIVEIDPITKKSVLLFDDPRPRLFSGATAAVEHHGLLVAGSALDKGLLVCEAPRE